jgi:hypothetical protein
MDIKPIICFTIGAAVGASCTYLFASKHFEKKMNESLSEMHDFYEKRQSGELKSEFNESDITKESSPVHVVDLDAMDKEIVDEVKVKLDNDARSRKEIYEKAKKAFTDYSLYSNKGKKVKAEIVKNESDEPDNIDEDYLDTEDDEFEEEAALTEEEAALTEEEEESAELAESLTKNTEPYLINDVQYFTENRTYSKLQLTLYDDGVLCGSNDEPVSDIPNLIGSCIEDSNDFSTKVFYVRNDNLLTDFEVIIEDDAYGYTHDLD